MCIRDRRIRAARGGVVAALDVGTSKIACLIGNVGGADVIGDAPVRVSGFGHRVSRGLNGGQVVDMRATEDSLRAAVEAAERMAGTEVRRVIVGMTAGDIMGRLCAAEVPLNGAAVDDAHLTAGLQHAYEKMQSETHEILHAIPIDYGIDGSTGISDPRGMYGTTLKVTLHVVAAPVGAVRNLLACVERCYLECEKLVATPYASALATLQPDEMELGTLHVDMGGGTTGFTIFHGGAPVFIGVVPVGGHHVTSDLARGLNVSLAVAERIKTLHGSALDTPSSDRAQFEVPTPDGDHRMRPRGDIARIIRPRIEETLEMVAARVAASGLAHLAANRVVLTGGAAQLSGVPELARAILEKEPRIAAPAHIAGLPETATAPSFAACAGLLNYAARRTADALPETPEASVWWRRLGGWLKRNF